MKKLSIVPLNLLQAKSLVGNYHDYISRIVVGNNTFALRQSYNFSIEEISNIMGLLDNFNTKIYVSVNKLFHNNQLEELKEYLIQLDKIGIDGIIFSDFCVQYIVEENNLNLNLEYSTETTITNNSFSKFANENNISSIDLAREITLEEVNYILENKECEVAIQIHGYIYMYQSVRNIVDNFKKYQDIEFETNNLKLYDEERDVYYPIIQNEQGTHVLASTYLSMIDNLEDINLDQVDYLKIESLGYTLDQYNKIIKLYIDKLNNLNNKTNYLEDIKEINKEIKYSTGFYYKKTTF